MVGCDLTHHCTATRFNSIETTTGHELRAAIATSTSCRSDFTEEAIWGVITIRGEREGTKAMMILERDCTKVTQVYIPVVKEPCVML
jgi:hypothetical protein